MKLRSIREIHFNRYKFIKTWRSRISGVKTRTIRDLNAVRGRGEWNFRRLLPRTISPRRWRCRPNRYCSFENRSGAPYGTVVCSSQGIPISFPVHPRGIGTNTLPRKRSAFSNPERPAKEKEEGEEKVEETERENEST